MPIQPLKVPRLHQRIAAEIEELIRSGSFPPGSRLPAERQLARSLVVSRSSLREALSALELKGLVQIRIGSGAWICERLPRAATAGAMSPTSSEAAPLELLRTRRLIEPEAAALAARGASAEQRAAIAEAFQRLEHEMGGKATHPQADRDFHVLIARCSGNAAIAGVVERLWDEYQSPLGQRMEALYVTAERRCENIEEHRAILDAVLHARAGDARRAMRLHLRRAERQRLTELGRAKTARARR